MVTYCNECRKSFTLSSLNERTLDLNYHNMLQIRNICIETKQERKVMHHVQIIKHFSTLKYKTKTL